METAVSQAADVRLMVKIMTTESRMSGEKLLHIKCPSCAYDALSVNQADVRRSADDCRSQIHENLQGASKRIQQGFL